MIYIALAFAVLAAGLHVIIFVFESVLWTQEPIWRRFKLESQDQAELTRPLAFNQGFYNLFLAVGAVVGVLLATAGDPATSGAGVGMVLLAMGSMLGAALVLLVTKPAMLRGVVIQGVAPLVAIIGMLAF